MRARAAYMLTSCLVGGLLAVPSIARGGGAENAVVIADPTSPESLYVANYYVAARGIPPQNVLYLQPVPSTFSAFAAFQKEALIGVTANRRTLDHIDFVVIPPGANFYTSASQLVSDGCSPVTRFSASSAYVLSFLAEDILRGTSDSTRRNHYFSTSYPLVFDSSARYRHGVVTDQPDGERYFIGALLGYSGPRGNTLDETLAMIDRAVAVDGTRPLGTFYFMKTTDRLRSGPRDGAFSSAIANIINQGGQAEQIEDILPIGRHDCLGIMTGWATPNIDGGDFTILPGAMCDHLTSYAGTFDVSGQTKMSRWIVRGAAGTYGTVEEPCNYPGKFPHPMFHAFYYAGLTLGEAGLRSLTYLPFQVLAYGDPLTRPFAYLPRVEVPGFPTDDVAGSVTFTPSATTDRPGGGIAFLDLLVNGVALQRFRPGEEITIDTTRLPDGPNDVRVIAYETDLVRAQGRWIGTLHVSNHGLSAAVVPSPATGDRSTVIQAAVSAAGGSVRELRLMQNGRVLASTTEPSATLPVRGEMLGAGTSRLYVEADFADGRSAISPSALVTLNYSNPPTVHNDTVPPVAYGYTRQVALNRPMIVELPAFDPDDPNPSFQIVTWPLQATVEGTGPYRLIKPRADAAGIDTLGFQAISSGRVSNTAVVTLVYGSYVACEAIHKLKTRCRSGKVQLTIQTLSWDFEGGVMTVSLDGRSKTMTFVNRKAKVAFKRQSSGDHVLTLVDPPGCREPMIVTCP